LIREHLEDVLAGTLPANDRVSVHLKECEECRDEVDGMRTQNQVLRSFKAGADFEPRAGFYARVLERIELQRPISIWALFTDSVFGRRLATASLSMAMLMGLYMVSTEQQEQSMFAAQSAVEMDPLYPSAGFAASVMDANASDNGAVLLSLVSYRER
jgi:predicted anti-sigma-YlaC factor YlaD